MGLAWSELPGELAGAATGIDDAYGHDTEGAAP